MGNNLMIVIDKYGNVTLQKKSPIKLKLTISKDGTFTYFTKEQ